MTENIEEKPQIREPKSDQHYEPNFALVPVYSTKQKMSMFFDKTPLKSFKPAIKKAYKYLKVRYPIDLKVGLVKKYTLVEDGIMYKQTRIGKYALLLYAIAIALVILLI